MLLSCRHFEFCVYCACSNWKSISCSIDYISPFQSWLWKFPSISSHKNAFNRYKYLKIVNNVSTFGPILWKMIVSCRDFEFRVYCACSNLKSISCLIDYISPFQSWLWKCLSLSSHKNAFNMYKNLKIVNNVSTFGPNFIKNARILSPFWILSLLRMLKLKIHFLLNWLHKSFQSWL